MRQRTGGYAHMWWMAVGGEIFAKTAKTPPLQSGVGGDIIAIQIRPLPSSMETRKLYNDAARRVATSSEERENRF